MAIQIRKAERRKAKLRLGLMGASGSGKTYSALQLAFGLGGKVGLIDTEHGSGELYAELGDYDVIQLDAPYTVAKYREAIRAFEEAGYTTIIIDSLSHAWAGEGGLLDKQARIQAASASKNGYMAWREVTPDHNKLVEELLNSPAHIIGTMRTKTEYVLEVDEKGHQVPRKIGLAPIQRDGLEYEFTVVLDIAENHYAHATKDRTALLDGWSDLITTETGKRLLDWLERGTEPVAPPPPPPAEEYITKEQARELTDLFAQHTSLAGKDLLRPALTKWGIPDLLHIRPDDYESRHAWIQGKVKDATLQHEYEGPQS